MDRELFKKIVIEEARKVIFEGQENLITNKTSKTVEEISKITPEQVKALAEEMKKINKKIDFNNPIINESVKKVVSEASNEEGEVILNRDRELDVDLINKQKHINFQNEAEKDKWKRMLDYNVPDDEQR